MDYIVVDFEWNQSAYGKGSTNKKLPFEIIEIGAVKLNEKRQFVEEFHGVIRPKVYRSLNYVTQELTGFIQEELDQGELFPHTIVDFILWCGEAFMFCTWGDMDLTELQRNMKFYKLDDLLVVQKFTRSSKASVLCIGNSSRFTENRKTGGLSSCLVRCPLHC